MDQKWPNFDFQPKNSMSNTDLIHLKIIFNLEYWISRTIFNSAMIWLIHLWKVHFLKKGPIFVVSCASKNNSNEKYICWHQLFRQKWAFCRVSTTVLYNCGHTNDYAHKIEFNLDIIIRKLEMSKKMWFLFTLFFKGWCICTLIQILANKLINSWFFS